MDNNLLDDTYQQTFEGTVKNALTITKLEREHTLGKLRCLANNNNITRPVESSVVLKMLCKLIYELENLCRGKPTVPLWSFQPTIQLGLVQ